MRMRLARMNRIECGQKSGIALVEVVCMLIVAAILASVCFPLLAKLFVANNQLKHELNWQRGVHELGLQLRRDARFADQATVDPDDKLQMETSAARIEYEFVDGVVRRTSHSPGGELLGREGFLIAEHSSARFIADTDQVAVQLKIPSFRLIKRAERQMVIVATMGGQP